MDLREEKNTADISAAVNEGEITPLQLMQEIQPLLNEYFIGDFEIKNNVLCMIFKNGQNFNLQIQKIV
ncbi:MAG: hypothetical protein HFK06_00015 [Clostridia bacterium]|jgi:hypothetical protein|nr:hypothetical protein [Clostridia bacterium]